MRGRRKRKKKPMIIQSAGHAIDVVGGKRANSVVSTWLGVAPNTVSTWRERGISRNYAVHFFAELVEKRGHKLTPQVFGLDTWDMVLVPDARGRKLKRVA